MPSTPTICRPARFAAMACRQTGFAVESAIDELARGIGMDPIEFRRRNTIRTGEAARSASERLEHDVDYSSNGLEQCLDLVRDAMQRRQDTDRDAPDGWLIGEGAALTMIHTVPPRGTSRIRGSVCATTAVTI